LSYLLLVEWKESLVRNSLHNDLSDILWIHIVMWSMILSYYGIVGQIICSTLWLCSMCVTKPYPACIVLIGIACSQLWLALVLMDWKFIKYAIGPSFMAWKIY